ncbi:hypothetical protein EYF80_055640 [Liparis tanakae]|uniref:Uncharacterized protein n=1 Tax=Liparis tanakae TaxID=230148 RepID=A0A4Z2EZ00_9TELE|nr:hypothetical protein EYF80_055640 [Liparis tanakae]
MGRNSITEGGLQAGRGRWFKTITANRKGSELSQTHANIMRTSAWMSGQTWDVGRGYTPHQKEPSELFGVSLRFTGDDNTPSHGGVTAA